MVFHAACKGLPTVIELLLNHHVSREDAEEGVRDARDGGTRALHIVAKYNRIDVALVLASVPHLDPAEMDYSGETPLQLAVSHGHTRMVEILLSMLDTKVDVSRPISKAIHFAAAKGYIDIVKALLAVPNVDFNANAVNYHGDGALHSASRAGHTRVVEALLTVPDIDVNAKNRDDATALLLAARNGRVEVAKVLLEVPNVDINACNKQKDTALHCAALNNCVDVVKALLANPQINVNVRNNKGKTPLHYAAWLGHVDVTKALIETPNIDFEAVDACGDTPLQIATSERGKHELVNLLKKAPLK